MGAQGPQIIPPRFDRGGRVFARLFQNARVRKPGGREQVAAVCYRWRKGEIEFLLVRTGGGRWTFPKGGTEPGLTHAQAAAIEAFEEAGVHGRIEELPFARYMYRKGGNSEARRLPVRAHLCEVSRRGQPKERNRMPTWFSAVKAKQRLSEDRRLEDGAELARVVERAVLRIRRQHSPNETPSDALKKIQFEALEPGPAQRDRTHVVVAVNSYLSQVRRLKQARHGLGEAENVQVIEFNERGNRNGGRKGQTDLE